MKNPPPSIQGLSQSLTVKYPDLSVLLKTRCRLTDHRQTLSRIELLSQQKLRSSSIFKNILSSWVKRRFHSENQLSGLPGSALKVSVCGVLFVFVLTTSYKSLCGEVHSEIYLVQMEI